MIGRSASSSRPEIRLAPAAAGQVGAGAARLVVDDPVADRGPRRVQVGAREVVSIAPREDRRRTDRPSWSGRLWGWPVQAGPHGAGKAGSTGPIRSSATSVSTGFRQIHIRHLGESVAGPGRNTKIASAPVFSGSRRGDEMPTLVMRISGRGAPKRPWPMCGTPRTRSSRTPWLGRLVAAPVPRAHVMCTLPNVKCSCHSILIFPGAAANEGDSCRKEGVGQGGLT